FTDVDLTDTPTATKSTSSVSAIGQDGTTALTLTAEQRAAIEAAFSIENVKTNGNDGTVNWAYNISEANLDFLGQGQVVTAVFSITVTDDEGVMETQNVTITLVGDNDTPIALANLPNIAGTSSLVFGPVTLASNLFEDADFGENQTLTYSLDGLPDGLIFNANSLTISGVAVSGFEGANLLHLVATDIHGAQAKIPILLTLESAPVTIDVSPDTGSATDVSITSFTAPDINLNIDALPSGTLGDGVDSRGFSSEGSDSSNGSAEAVASSSINADASGVVVDQGSTQVFESQVSVNVDANGQVQITQSDSLDQGVSLSVEDIVPQEVGVDIKLTDIGIGSYFSATLSDGTDLPSWVEVDPNTGDVFIDPPEGQEKITLKINARGFDGITRILEVEIDLESLSESVGTDTIHSDVITDAKEGHMTFEQQLELASNEQDNYGSDLMKLLAS
ncbi:putative Ig domain-containing protein, partial [Marinomonas balearica]